MKVTMCVSNLDLFSIGDDNLLIKRLLDKDEMPVSFVKIEEVHCLGLCFLCQCGPTAMVNNQIIHKSLTNDFR